MNADETPAGLPRVAIGIATYRRPADLQRLLSRLPDVTARAIDSGLAQSVRVLVIDNDPEGSARPVVTAAAISAHYAAEPEPGVAAARNRVLTESVGDDVLVFIDDDETPERDSWLADLLRVRREFSADAVAGPVRTVSTVPLDPWVEQGAFFARAHRDGLSDGAPIAEAASNNLLLDLAFLQRHGLRFDDRFGRSGGEDSFLTLTMHTLGARMVWAASAGVIDHLPPERQSRAHAVARVRAMASTGVRVRLALASSMPARMRIRLKSGAIGAARTVLGALQNVAGRLRGSVGVQARGAKALARGIGTVEGAFGVAASVYGAPAEAPH